MKYKGNLLIIGCLLSVFSFGQLATINKTFTKADTLRGSITKYREGWDVLHYDLSISIDINNKAISGSNEISYNETLPVRQMQIDLQKPLIIDSVVSDAGQKLSFTNEGNVWLIRIRPDDAMIKFKAGERKLKVYYHGIPKEALNAPWDGGVVWQKDLNGNPWITTACQGIGASTWWPCKDHQSDEPDKGMSMHFTVPDSLTAVSNGRLQSVSAATANYKTWNWIVKNPINSYGVSMNVGKYINWTDTLGGVAGNLDLSYWVLDYNLNKAKLQFEQVKPMLRCFEYWFGKYPFYEDSYKLVEVNFLGMEHQSAVAYGNRFSKGYQGKDLSGTGWGTKWDYIIVHESGHEWFGNNITTNDIADMWVHEGFTDYSETLYTEWLFGKKAGNEYNKGLRRSIKNDRAIIGPYGVNEEGSSDMYYKGANLIHFIRQVVNDDDKFRNLLRELNRKFYHKTIVSKDVESYISSQTAIDFSKLFNQYLRTTQIPQLEYYFSSDKKNLNFRWTNCISGFDAPIVLKSGNNALKLSPTTTWTSTDINDASLFNPSAIEDVYYIKLKQVNN